MVVLSRQMLVKLIAFSFAIVVAIQPCYVNAAADDDAGQDADGALNDESYGEDGADDLESNSNLRKLTDAEVRAAYALKKEEPESLPAFQAPKLPDLSGYNYGAVLRKVDKSKKGTVSLGSILSEPGFKVLTYNGSVGLSAFARLQGGGLRAIVISGGLVTLKDIAAAISGDYFQDLGQGRYLARLPILVRHGATLLVDKSVKQFRLGAEKGSLLSIEGRLVLSDSEIVGWDETRNRTAELKDPKKFRPFIVSWGGSDIYLARSRVAHLGYAAKKAYGLSLSQYGSLQLQSKVWPRPTGWIIETVIEDLWYGLYTWEADGVVMHSNVMKNNILYGFDPHDRSRHLIIANNDVYGTKIKHGIIISREVNNSWIFGNRTHDNHKAGIVLDRQCSNNVVANNIATQNGSDGIIISESSKNIVWNNVVSGNNNHGIRLRNSTEVRVQDNVALANGLTGVYGAAVDLSGTTRDFVHDSYTKQLGMTVVGGQYTSNGSGPFGLDYPTKASFYQVDLRTPQRQLGFRLGGMLPPFQIELLDILLNQNKVAVVQARK